jgi:hypothetical protein
VDHLPNGVDFDAFYYGSDGQNNGGQVYALDQSGVYFNRTDSLSSRVECCNFAMSQGLAAWGIYFPYKVPGSNGICYVFNVRDKDACDPSAVKYTIASSNYITAPGASAL